MSPTGDHVRKAVIAGNWKMHMTCAEARAFAAAFRPLIADLPDDREVVLAACAQNGGALVAASKQLRNDKQVVSEERGRP